MNTQKICPVCEQGKLSPTKYGDFYEFRGTSVFVEGLVGEVCDHCGEISNDAPDIRSNQQTLAASRKEFANLQRVAAGLLTCDEVAAIRKRWDLSQAVAAKVFGGGANAFSKYERGEVHQSEAMDLLLRLANEVSGAMAWLLHSAGLSQGRAQEWESVARARPALRIVKARQELSVNDDDYSQSVQWRTATRALGAGR